MLRDGDEGTQKEFEDYGFGEEDDFTDDRDKKLEKILGMKKV